MEKNRKKCIECGGETHAIRVIDRGQKNIHYELVYATGDSKRNVFKGHEIEGSVHAEMYEICGRIALRGAPKS
jgi:hypothetical protein